MALVYEPEHWLDHVTEFPGRRELTQVGENLVQLKRAEGRTLQQGTPKSASRFNHLEMGVLEAYLLAQVLEQQMLQAVRDIEDLTGEYGEVTISGTGNYPFSEGSVTVPLKVSRATLDYRVETEIAAVEGGMAESVTAYAKQKNGFKLAYKGSAKRVKIKYWVTEADFNGNYQCGRRSESFL